MTPFAYGVRVIAAYNLARHMNLTVYGRDLVPDRGPAILAARHYHHLYDGAALVMGLRRQPHLFVALDWTRSPLERLVMETACSLAQWPVALRGDNVDGERAFAKSEVRRYVRSSLASASDVLERGDLLAIFPEGYPTIDPSGSRKENDTSFLPFAPGVLAIADRAQRATGMPIPILPVGFRYALAANGRCDIAMRIGAPIAHDATRPRAAVIADLEARVRALSE